MRNELVVLLLLACTCAPTWAQRDFSDVQIETTLVRDGVYVLKGRGGNIGVSSGDDGVLLIDDQFAPLNEKILAAVSAINTRSVRFVVNTHWHGDHTGGNEPMGEAGAVIVAHDNVRQRMSVRQLLETRNRDIPAAPHAALPVVTFADSVTFHFNGDELRVVHVPGAHTDGDSIIHFRRADVIHMGDVLFNGMYPFIDLDSGGSIDGLIAAVDRALELGGERTRFIAGHGPVAGRTEVAEYRRLLGSVRDRVAGLIADGKSLDEIRKARPTAEFDEQWGKGFIPPDTLVETVHASLTAR